MSRTTITALRATPCVTGICAVPQSAALRLRSPPFRTPGAGFLRDGDAWTVAYVLPGGAAELWFECEPRHAAHLTSRADPWPLALLFTAMQHGAPLAVDGSV